MYACFAALLVSESNSLRAKGDVTLKAKLVGLTVAIVFGGIIELLQGTTLIGRGCSLADFIANSTGATAAILLYKFFNTKLKGLI